MSFWDDFQTGYNVVSDWRRSREERRDRQVDRKRRDAAYQAALEQYGPVAAYGAGGPGDASALDDQFMERETYNQERLRNAQRGVLGALRQVRERGGDLGATFDQLTPILPSLGISEDQIGALREQIVANPNAIDAFEEALGDPSGSRLIGSPQAAYDSQGRPVFLAFDRSGRPTEIEGYSPASTVLGEERIRQGDTRLGISQGSLDERRRENDPTYRQDRAAADALGRAQGTAQAGIDALEETVDQINTRIDAVTADADLGAVLGLPSLRGVTRGGLGALGPPIPGTPAADVLAQLRALSSQIRLQAYESLRGAGQITEAESLFGEQAQGNLERIQSPEALLTEIENMRDRLNGRLRAVRRGSTRRLEAPSGTRPAPQQRGERRSLDDILNQYAPR